MEVAEDILETAESIARIVEFYNFVKEFHQNSSSPLIETYPQSLVNLF